MKKLMLDNIWKGLVIVALLLASINAYLEWFVDRGNESILIITLLIIILATATRIYSKRLNSSKHR